MRSSPTTPEADNMDDLKRIEENVFIHLGEARVIGLIYTGKTEREGYSERIYVIAWENEHECGTHQANVNSKEQCAFFFGHYQLTHERALQDIIGRARERDAVTS
jgi:hypothetical protein